MKVEENIILIEKFSEYLYARVGVLELLHIDELNIKKEIYLDRPEKIILTVDDKETFDCLKESEYFYLLGLLITNFKLPPQVVDIFRSHFEDDYLEQLLEEINTQKKQLRISCAEDGSKIVIDLPFLLREIIFPVISQLHIEFIHNYMHFKPIIKLLDGNPQSLFLNAKSASAYSQFIQMWVAESLKIPKTPYGDYNY